MKDNKSISQGERTTAIDWSEVHRRLEATQAAIELGTTPLPEEKRAILRARARALADDPNEKKATGESMEILEFLLGDESYGMEVGLVREVYPLKELTPLPGTPSFVLGITNVRGEILSVIDMKEFFGLPEMETTDHGKIVIVYSESMVFGILADHISGVRLIPLEEIQPPPPTLTGISAEYLRGVTSERTVILDAKKMLSDKQIIVAEEVRA